MHANPNVLVHIGYYKTGTTFLQDQYFTDHPDINFVGCSDKKYFPEELLRLIYASPKSWDDTFRLPLSPDKLNVISFESFSGAALWTGGRGMTLDIRTAERLKTVFPGARILIVIREQFSMLKSVYWQYIWEGGTLGFPGFVRHALQGIDFFTPRQLAYDGLICKYQELFGRSAVLVLPVEQLARNCKIFLETVNRFMRAGDFSPSPAASNVSPGSALAFLYVRLVNRLLRMKVCGSVQHPLLRRYMLRPWTILNRFPGKQRFHMDSAQRDTMARIFQESNRTTVRCTGLNLADYGYIV
jgi:hypothetical protein